MTRTEIKQAADVLRQTQWVDEDMCRTLIAADELIDKLEAENSGLKAARIAYATEFQPDTNGEPDVGSIHQNIRKLKADKAKLREALIKCKWVLRLETSKDDDAWDAAVDALEETSDE